MRTRSYDTWKRAIDVVVATVGLVFGAPVIAAVAAAVRLRLGSPVLFRQQRPGKDEQIFELVKFRTMLDVDERAGLVTDEQRLTPFGSLLRSTSLDELPTLWNVLKGEMSMVGPRPLLVRYTEHFTPRERTRLSVRPGITGWAQVNGRNRSPWTERLEMDAQYVESRSLRLDLRCLSLTIGHVLRRHGVVVAPDSVMLDLDEERNPR